MVIVFVICQLLILIVIFAENKSRHDGYDPADSDGDVLIEKETLPSLGRFAVTLPVTFFDYPRNVSLLNRCKPFLIKVVDVKKHRWYYEKQNQILRSKNIIKSYTEVQRIRKDIEKVQFNMHSEALKPKIRPVDITAYADYNKLMKRNSSLEQINYVKANKKKSHLPRPADFRKVEYVDFKKNVGLVGLKISHTIDLNISNAEVTDARPKDKEVQAKVAICGDSAKLSLVSRDKPKTCFKVENTTKRLLKTDQDNINLVSKNKDPSDGSVHVKKPLISLNNKVNKEFNEKVETVNGLEKRTFFMNECFNPNKGKHNKIEKIAENLMLKEILTTSTTNIYNSTKNKCLIGRHIKFDPGILATKRELDKKAKLPFGSQKISTKVAECIDVTDSKKNPKKITLTEDGKTEVSSESKKGKKKAENEKKDNENGINVALYNNNVLKMVMSKKSNTSLNINQNSYTVRDGKNLTKGEQTTKTPDITQDVTYYLKPHDAYANVPIRKSLPNNGLLTDNNGLNYYPNSSKNHSTIANTSTSSQVSEHNLRISVVEHNQLSSICADKPGHLNNISASITKTDKPESHVISGPPSEISMRIDSNNGKSAALMQNITAMDNSVIQRTSLPKVTCKHSNLPGIVQKKACSPITSENISQIANDTFTSGKSTEIQESRSILTVSDNTTKKQANSEEPAQKVYEMFDAKGNVMNNEEIYVKRTVIKSNVKNNTKQTSKAINQGLTQVAQQRRNTSDIFVINHQSTSSPINHGETHKIYARPTFSKSNIPEEKSRIIVDQVSTQVVQHRNNTSECVTKHQLNPGLISHSESQEIIARRLSDSKYCANVGNNNIFNKTNSDGYFSGPDSVPVRTALALHWNGTLVPSQGYQGEFQGANSNRKSNSSFAQEKSNLQQRYSMAYTNNMRNFQSNMNMNQGFTGGNEGLNVNVPHNNKAVSTYQPMPQKHVGYLYQGQPIRSLVGNRPTQGLNRSTHMQKNMMNIISVDTGLPSHHMMQNEVPMNNTHCAPFYRNIFQDMNLPVEASYYNPNQSNALWSYLHPPAPPPPPPPVQTTGTFFPPTRTVNAPPQSAFVPSSVANNSSIIGCNNSGIIRKINIVAVPLTDKEKPSNTSSVFTMCPVDNSDDKPANSKLEMLEELTKVIMDIPPDSPVEEKKLSYLPSKPSKGVFSQPSEPSLSLNAQDRSIPTTVQEGALSSINGASTAPGQNVPTLIMSEHNIPSMTQARPNVQSSKLSKRDSPIRSPPKQTTASSPKTMTECPSTEASTEKHNKTFASSSSPKIHNSKRPHPATEAPYPEMRKILSSDPKVRPGPLSKKPKLHVFEKPPSPNRDPRGKSVLPAANIGYSPPILPILTYEKTLEYIAQVHPETKNVKEKDEFAPNEDKLPVSSLRSSSSKNNCSKRKLCYEDKQTTQDKLVKKISLDEYKKRVGINSEKDHSVNNIPIKLECKTEKFNDTKQCSDLDLGYDSDSTMIL